MVRRVAPAAGRYRVKLAEMLLAVGVVVTPEDIEPRGGSRRNRTAGDGERWESFEAFAHGHPTWPDGQSMHLLSYETIKDLVRSGGVELEYDTPTWLVWSKGSRAEAEARQAAVNTAAEAAEQQEG